MWDTIKIVGNLGLAILAFFVKRSFDELTSSVKEMRVEVTALDRNQATRNATSDLEFSALKKADDDLKRQVEDMRREMHDLRDRLMSCPGCSHENE